jgi:hypothetical protein
LPPVVRFLSELKKTGRLLLTQDDWSGEVVFRAGDVTDATLGSRTGLAALDGMLEVFPEASFTFDSRAPAGGTAEPTIQLSHDALLAHLDAAAARVASGGQRLPRPDAVPAQVAGDGGGEDPLPLDRGTLQTLLTVDGQRSVREIVATRQSIETLWHLASLAEVGLITFNGKSSASAAMPPTVATANAVHSSVAAASEPTLITAAPTTAGSTPPVSHCPKLGFEDDPASSFGRPTRLHRCFAGATPQSLSLDQQREVCLSEQFGACSRLNAVQATPTPRAPRPGMRRVEPSTVDEPRIVRLPFGARTPPAARPPEEPRPAASQPTPLRAVAPPASRPPVGSQPTVARARLERPTPTQSAAAAATASPVRAPTMQPLAEPPMPPAADAPPPHEQARAAAQSETLVAEGRRRIGQIPVVALAAGGLVILLIAAMLYLLLPQLFGDSGLDANTLPNARLVEEGTPVTVVAPARATPIAAASAVPASDVGAGGAQATSAATAQPSTSAAAAQPSAVPVQASPAAAGGQPIFDERFNTNDARWPSNPQGLGQFTNGSYRIGTRQAGQSAAIGAPVANVPDDVQITADFRKLGGPDGGGYGVLVRDQEQGARDGSSQDGRYYVLEVGDKGEVGIWRRDGDHWVDLVPWQHADAVKPGTAQNTLTVRAVGNTLGLSVNGTQVATATDSTLSSGGAGVFVGGDGNQVALTRYTIQAP